MTRVVVWEKADAEAGCWRELMHCLDVSRTFQTLFHLNPMRTHGRGDAGNLQEKADAGAGW